MAVVIGLVFALTLVVSIAAMVGTVLPRLPQIRALLRDGVAAERLPAPAPRRLLRGAPVRIVATSRRAQRSLAA